VDGVEAAAGRVSRAPQREVLLEFTVVGAFAKVSAIDPVSKVEVSITGPALADRAALEAAAVRKLDYVLKRKVLKRKRGGK